MFWCPGRTFFSPTTLHAWAVLSSVKRTHDNTRSGFASTLSKNAGLRWTPHNPLHTFDVSDNDHDEEAVVVGVVRMVNAGSDLARADHLLQGDQHQLDRQEGHTLVEEVEGAVKDQVPVTEGKNIRISF